MNMKEIATLFGVKERNASMKNKKKAVEIMEKILQCPKCKKPMKWIEGTNVCVCQDCTYTVGKKESKETFSVSKEIQNRSRKFLENNYHYMESAKESKEV